MHSFPKALLILLAIIYYFPIIAQSSGKYYSINDALNQPDSVKELQLSGITEKLPKELSKFKNLEVVRLINLSDNYDLNDAFEKLSKSGSVKKIYLYGNAHNTLPKSISKIKSLEFIELNNKLKNSLPEIIKYLSEIDSFKSLSLRSMNLTELPPNINLLKIKHLNLDNNPNLNYQSVFKLLSQLRLESLNLSSGNFSVIPEDIIKLSSIKKLDLQLINGNFNNEESFLLLSKLPNLEELNIQGNFFGRLDPSIKKLSKLKLIEIDGNCIEGDDLEELKKLLPNTIIQNEIPC